MQASLMTTRSTYPALLDTPGQVSRLQNGERNEVLAFLERRPIYTAQMAGMIRDNGLQSNLNRGTFYAYRNAEQNIEGVALIGHATLIETASDDALMAFAHTARDHKSMHLIMCEQNRIENFWMYYATAGQEMRRACRELLFELRWPVEISHVSNLRQATPRDLPLLIPVHAEMALAESGVDPRTRDAAGFIERYTRRIQKGRTWILTEDGKLQFKAEVVAETPETTYIEGVWVNPELRSQGYGRRCMSQLARLLLWRTKSICLFVNDENEQARQFYRQAGYHLRSVYDTVFVK